jgi:hypothetical protein
MEQNKPVRLLYKLIAGLMYTDIELRPKHELEAYATAICATIGEAVDGERLIANLVSNGVLTLRRTEKGVEYYSHNLPKTLSHRHERPDRKPA